MNRWTRGVNIHTLRLLLGISLLVLGSLSIGRAAESGGMAVKLTDTPAAVQATIKSQLGGGRLGEIVKTSADGEELYDVELIRPGRERNLVVNDKGEVVEMQVFLNELTHPLQAAIRKEVGTGKIEEITKNFDDGEVSYEIEMTSSGKTRTFTLDESGGLTEMQVFLDELPEPVRKAIQKETASGKGGEIDRTNDGDEVAYATEVTKDGKTRSLTFDTNGNLVYEEQPIALAEAPEAVRKSIQERLAGGKLASLSKVVNDGETSYIADVLKSGKHNSLSISAEGKLADEGY